MLKKSLLFLLLFVLIGCREQLPLVRDSYQLSTSTPQPTPTTAPTATAVTEAADGVGRAYYRAWEGFDYEGMYSLLSTESQAVIALEDFVALYQEMMQMATVTAIHAQPMNAYQDNDKAQMQVRVIWETAVVGEIARDYTVNLAFRNGRWGIVWNESLILPELQGGQKLYMAYHVPARANIYDRNTTALAYQGAAITLSVIPGDMRDEQGLLNVLSAVLGETPDQIKQKYANALPNWRVPVGIINSDVMQQHLPALQPYINQGLMTEQELTRLYKKDGVAPHIVGYMGAIQAESLETYQEMGYRGDERVGLSGVEAWGEEYLRGVRGGELTIIAPNGEYISTVQKTEPRQARSIYLTIDAEFQRKVEQALAEVVTTTPGQRGGSVVVLDVRTGKVLAMATYPSYDPTVFDVTRPDAAQALNALFNDPNTPLLNRPVQGAYPAGSIFKIVTLTAGLNSGTYTMDTTYHSTGRWGKLGDGYIKTDWRAGGHGTVTYKRAITVSCNTCFYDMGFNLNGIDPFILPNIARQFLLGQPTGVVGINEVAGLIPDPEWKLNAIGGGWVPGDAVNMAIGQGYVQVTPLQIASIFAAIANGGTFYRPTVIDRIGAAGGAPEELWPTEEIGKLPLSPEHLAILQSALREVATADYGTASHRFVGLPVPVAGKTGTAEDPGGPNGLPHSWFGGYAPVGPYTRPDGTTIDQPEIAVVTMIENAGEGSTYAAPLFRRIVELYYGIPPTPFHWR